MKNGSLILVSVLALCGLFGFGVSQASKPLVQSIDSSVQEMTSVESSPENYDLLENDLKAHYKDIVLTEENLQSLSCKESDATPFLFSKQNCYSGPTQDVTKYGTSQVVMGGENVTVQLVSMPAGAFLIK